MKSGGVSREAAHPKPGSGAGHVCGFLNTNSSKHIEQDYECQCTCEE